MALFWRVNSNELTPLFNTENLGFPAGDPSFIPDEYLANKEFILLRTCHSVGDWGIISAFPRLLKEKYPDCKVYLPSANLLAHMFKGFGNWNHWSAPFKNVEVVFDNNPYVDGYLDSITDEVFHDHYRIYDTTAPEVPLIQQMLKFWQFSDNEMQKYYPEVYFSPEEVLQGGRVIEEYIGTGNFGTLLLTNTVQEYYSDSTNRLLLEATQPYKDNIFFYYGSKTIEETIFKELNTIDLSKLNLPIRIQLFIKSKATINIGYQSGVNDTISGLAPVICTPSTGRLGADYLGCIKYLR
tara:strand:- start:3443 stop:4330 length:888 start_codon:yes stop_codon:yes gene_type:complete